MTNSNNVKNMKHWDECAFKNFVIEISITFNVIFERYKIPSVWQIKHNRNLIYYNLTINTYIHVQLQKVIVDREFIINSQKNVWTLFVIYFYRLRCTVY